MQIPILSGIFTDGSGEYRTFMPVNLEPAIVESGISQGQLRSSPGIEPFATSSGSSRGAIDWAGTHYRVQGNSLVSVSSTGVVKTLGYIAGTTQAALTYSFDRLAVAGGGKLYYLDKGAVQEVTDPDLGAVLDVIFVDGYFMTTDGEFLVVTELNDPYAIDPLKYGSSEEDPDPVTGLILLRGEVYALNRYTIENFQNTGSTGFPFQRNSSALIPKGCVSASAKTPFVETFAFVGGGRNEGVGVYLAGGGTAELIASEEIMRILEGVPVDRLPEIVLEQRVQKGESRLLMHIPDGLTYVYHYEVSQQAGTPIWTVLASGAGGNQSYIMRNFALSYGKYIGATNDGAIGYLSDNIQTQLGNVCGWEFGTQFIYNESRGGIINRVELVGNQGNVPFGVTPTCFMSWTNDGKTWSNEFAVPMGKAGNTINRVMWVTGIMFTNVIGLRFRGANSAVASWARCEARIKPLRV